VIVCVIFTFFYSIALHMYVYARPSYCLYILISISLYSILLRYIYIFFFFTSFNRITRGLAQVLHILCQALAALLLRYILTRAEVLGTEKAIPCWPRFAGHAEAGRIHARFGVGYETGVTSSRVGRKCTITTCEWLRLGVGKKGGSRRQNAEECREHHMMVIII